MRAKKRKWDDPLAEDPGAGLVNLFDVWIAFAAALLLAALGYGHAARPGQEAAALEKIEKQRRALTQYRVSERQAGGEGERLGVAYRLKNGEVIYVPERQ